MPEAHGSGLTVRRRRTTPAATDVTHRCTESECRGSALSPIRMGLGAMEAALLAERLVDATHAVDHGRLLDQLWLRTVFIEQWRRTRISERLDFEQRADRMLAALDPNVAP